MVEELTIIPVIIPGAQDLDGDIVDITEQYIKMCIKAVEIQAKQQVKPSDLIYDIRDKYSLFVFNGFGKHYYQNYDYAIRDRTKYIWLPRQDQLQNMTNYNITPTVLHGKFSEFMKWLEQKEYEHQEETEGNASQLYPFTSLEQFWLAFIMKENYNKVWSGEDWIPDRLYCDIHKHYLDETNDVCPECEGEAEQEAAGAEWEAEQMARAEDEAREAENAERDAAQGGEGYYGE